MQFSIWGLSGSIATQHEDQMAFATERLWHWIDLFDATCNRFRTESEISTLNRHQGEAVAISETLSLALQAALRSSALTQGLCDPTILPSLLALGYNDDYGVIADRNDFQTSVVVPKGIQAVHLDEDNQTVRLDAGCQLDLGSSAKALLVDLVANDVMATGGVVVELGGDVALRGSGPDGDWVVGISDQLHISGNEPKIAFTNGGIATSSTGVRTWRAGGEVVNHIIDPRTGNFASSTITTATVCASDCVSANAFATAALLWGEEASYYIAQAGWSGRLVRHDGTVEFVGGWPREEEI